MSSSEEEDYMSDAFLTKMFVSTLSQRLAKPPKSSHISRASGDVRPGLVMSRTTVRQNEVETRKQLNDQQHRDANKSTRALEEERREEGLNTAIPSDSKGFAMLAKFGYKPGDTIGRTTAAITEPIKIQVKSGRGGLGKRSAQEQLKELRAKRSVAKESDWTDISNDFRQRLTQKRKDKELSSTL